MTPRLLTLSGHVLHLVATIDRDTYRTRCGLRLPHRRGWLVPAGERPHAEDCGNCARSLGSVA